MLPGPRGTSHIVGRYPTNFHSPPLQPALFAKVSLRLGEVDRDAGLAWAEKEKFPEKVWWGRGGADEQAAVNPEDFTKKELRLWAVAGNHHPARVPVSSQSLG